jgi:hypothetical protein
MDKPPVKPNPYFAPLPEKLMRKNKGGWFHFSVSERWPSNK